SSRRRHTRSKRDWSSDVCSSDLSSGNSSGRSTTGGGGQSELAAQLDSQAVVAPVAADGKQTLDLVVNGNTRGYKPGVIKVKQGRSEERRVGKECRCRMAREHENK